MFETFISNPKKLFILDAFGAILSAFLLGYLLVELQSLFGIPAKILYILALMPVIFSFYDFYCITKKNNELGYFMKVLAILNFTYCCISMSFAFFHRETITFLGWSYLIIEILIILCLSTIEFIVAKKIINIENNEQ